MTTGDALVWRLAEDAFNSVNGGGTFGPPFNALPEDEQAAHLRWASRALAHAWEKGHEDCSCDRPGNPTRCRNPYTEATS